MQWISYCFVISAVVILQKKKKNTEGENAWDRQLKYGSLLDL
jgi:hypothetical protein